jgi:glycosyltransferase involved in cell wall biosynthesis
MKNNSIVFIAPDYHYSFTYREQLRGLGWDADVYANWSYPSKLLYDEEGLLRPYKIYGSSLVRKVIDRVLRVLFYLKLLSKYRIHFYYGSLDHCSFFGDKLSLKGKQMSSFRLNLFLAKLFGRKVVFLPSGCLDNDTKAEVSKLDDGNICNNCGWGEDVCNDQKNIAKFNTIRRYADLVIRMGDYWENSKQLQIQDVKWKAVNLELWHPRVQVPDQYLLPPTKNLRILHSFYDKERGHGGKNIKGSPFILDAVECLKKEGYPVEYMYLKDIPSRDMRFYQAQADIVVEQLIYGWWGSTGVETMALGKPVVCYLRPSWKEFFFDQYPEYSGLPVVEANTKNIYEVLKKLVVDKEYRERKGRESRIFSEQHYDVKKNVASLVQELGKI